MDTALTRERALEALKKYNRKPLHILHTLIVEGAMCWFAQDQGYGEETDFQGAVGLLHDTDFEMYPERHRVKAPELLKKAGAEDELVRVVCSHGCGLVSDVEPEHQMEKILFISGELTDLIGATVRMRPPGSVMDMEVSSLKKKLKDERFAVGRSRDVIREGAEELDQALEELTDKAIQTIRSCKTTVSEEMKLYEAQRLLNRPLPCDVCNCPFIISTPSLDL